MALEKLKIGFSRKEIVSGAALGLHKNNDGTPKANSKYNDWAKESDMMDKEIKEAIELFSIIEEEVIKGLGQNG